MGPKAHTLLGRGLLIALCLLCALSTLVAPAGRFSIVLGESVHCCCGEHDVDDPCGCPTCPGNDIQEEDEASDAPAGPQIGRCGVMAQLSSELVIPMNDNRLEVAFYPPNRRLPRVFEKEIAPVSPHYRPRAPES